jgi:hypothetical protein
MFRRLVFAGVAASLLALPAIPSSASYAGPAASNSITKIAIKSGKVVPGGASITIAYSCFPSGYGPYGASGDVRVTQARGVAGVTGDTQFHPRCNDKQQTQAIFVKGDYARGDAAVGAFICGFDCNSTSKEIRLS